MAAANYRPDNRHSVVGRTSLAWLVHPSRGVSFLSSVVASVLDRSLKISLASILEDRHPLRTTPSRSPASRRGQGILPRGFLPVPSSLRPGILPLAASSPWELPLPEDKGTSCPTPGGPPGPCRPWHCDILSPAF